MRRSAKAVGHLQGHPWRAAQARARCRTLLVSRAGPSCGQPRRDAACVQRRRRTRAVRTNSTSSSPPPPLSARRKVPTRLELSSKIVTTRERLRTTLAHECCHVAAWVIEREYHQPHGPAFWRWADALMAHDKRRWLARQQPPQRQRAQQPGAEQGKEGVEEEEEEEAVATLLQLPARRGAAAEGVGALTARLELRLHLSSDEEEADQEAGATGGGGGRAGGGSPWRAGARATGGGGGSSNAQQRRERDQVASLPRPPQPAAARSPGAQGRAGAPVDEEEDDAEDGPVVITRLHNFEMHMPFRWQCSNSGCARAQALTVLWRRRRGDASNLAGFSTWDACVLPQAQVQQGLPAAPAEHRPGQARVQPVQGAAHVPGQVQQGQQAAGHAGEMQDDKGGARASSVQGAVRNTRVCRLRAVQAATPGKHARPPGTPSAAAAAGGGHTYREFVREWFGPVKATHAPGARRRCCSWGETLRGAGGACPSWHWMPWHDGCVQAHRPRRS